MDTFSETSLEVYSLDRFLTFLGCALKLKGLNNRGEMFNEIQGFGREIEVSSFRSTINFSVLKANVSQGLI